MQKFILISIVIATIAVPTWAAREKNARKGLRKALTWMVVFNVVYLVALMFIYPRLM